MERILKEIQAAECCRRGGKTDNSRPGIMGKIRFTSASALLQRPSFLEYLKRGSVASSLVILIFRGRHAAPPKLAAHPPPTLFRFLLFEGETPKKRLPLWFGEEIWPANVYSDAD